MVKQRTIKFVKCDICGGKYNPKDTEITLKINHRDIEAIEDIFFCELSDENWEKIRPSISKVWRQLCEQEISKKLFEGDN
jgi:hypothetical protein